MKIVSRPLHPFRMFTEKRGDAIVVPTIPMSMVTYPPSR